MQIETCSIPKYRDLSCDGDDVVLVVPDCVYAVFDGATDTAGSTVAGISPGRFAARCAAQTVLAYATSGYNDAHSIHQPTQHPWQPQTLLAAINQRIATGLTQAGVAIGRAGSTAAVVLDAGDSLHFLIVGDSAIRINAQELHRHTKDIDAIYSAGRVALLQHLQHAGYHGDALEHTARQLIFKGLAQAQTDMVSAEQAQHIVATAQRVCAQRLQADALREVPHLLMAGIAAAQYAYCNRSDHSLGYAVLNGTPTQGPDVHSFTRRKADVHSIELFTDGYLLCPTGSHVRDWEAAFHHVEQEDFHKSGTYAGVKGSTSAWFSDDRSVVTVHFAPAT